MSTKPEGLALLRTPFPADQISKLPKPTKAQTEAVRNDFKSGVRCEICGTWHHPKVVHLDYVGHAALTSRLLDADPSWNWEPLSADEKGLPLLDANGGLWIKLTVCGITRLGYGDAEGKTGPAAMKERIGDALRNAAMRFGAALDLWHKGDSPLYGGAEDDPTPHREERKPETKASPWTPEMLEAAAEAASQGSKAYGVWWRKNSEEVRARLLPTPAHKTNKETAERADQIAAELAQREGAEV